MRKQHKNMPIGNIIVVPGPTRRRLSLNEISTYRSKYTCCICVLCLFVVVVVAFADIREFSNSRENSLIQ